MNARLLVEAPCGDLVARKWRFDNGLHAILCRDPRTEVLAYQTWLRVGSRHERPGKTGLAHLFEHLMFNETEHLAAGEFDRRIEAVGGDTNAATWVDWTMYQVNVSQEHLELVAKLEADRLAHLVLREKQVSSEREVVKNERRFRVEDDPDGFLNERLYELAFRVHPYRWPTIGWMDDISAFVPEDCDQFYRRYYAPNRATLVLVGGFAEAQALEIISQNYGELSAQPIFDELAPAEPEPDGERRAHFQKPIANEKLSLGYRCPPLADADHPVLEVIHELLAGGPSARLWKRLVVDSEIASSVSGSVSGFHDPGLYEIHVSLMPNHRADQADEIIQEELTRLHHERVLAQDLEKARVRLESGFLWSLRSASAKAHALGHFEVTAGDFRRLFDLTHLYPQVSAPDIERVARKLLVPKRRVVVTAEPLS